MLSTGYKMIKWNQQANSACTLCNTAMETRDYLYFECSYSSDIWKGLTLKLFVTSYLGNWSTILQLLVDNRQDKIQLFLIRYTFQLTVHSLWREQNGRRHGEKHQTALCLQGHIDKSIRNRISTIQRTRRKEYDEAMG